MMMAVSGVVVGSLGRFQGVPLLGIEGRRFNDLRSLPTMDTEDMLEKVRNWFSSTGTGELNSAVWPKVQGVFESLTPVQRFFVVRVVIDQESVDSLARKHGGESVVKIAVLEGLATICQESRCESGQIRVCKVLCSKGRGLGFNYS